jgi:uncharacterized protein YggE
MSNGRDKQFIGKDPSMPRSTTWLSALLLIAPAGAALAQSSPHMGDMSPHDIGPIVSLSVTESVDSAPDMATINTGVQTRAMSAKDAMGQNAVQIDKLFAALIKAGIERKDLQTSGINLNPQYDYSNRTNNEPPKFIGYEASNQLTVTVRKIAKAGELVDAMVGAGATNINGPSFGITDTSKLETQARAKAIQSAGERAAFYAQAAGYKTARLIAISEGAEAGRPIIMTASRMAAAPDMATKIEPGQLSTSITLSFRYMLER